MSFQVILLPVTKYFQILLLLDSFAFTKSEMDPHQKVCVGVADQVAERFRARILKI